MDNLTHSLFGAVLARSGLAQRHGRGTTALLVIASNLPDLDAILLLTHGESSAWLRRTHSHSILGAPILALALGLCWWAATRGRIRLPAACAMALLGVAGHVGLDLLNSYGVVALWPFSLHRYELAWVYIIDLAMLALLAAPRRRPGWQWLVLGAALLQGLIFLVLTPYTWSGGGVGNRYYFSGYGVMLFLLPPIESIALAFTPWVVGALFVAPMVMNPFVAAFRPNENAKAGPLRLLPVELTLLNDLPVWTEGERARSWFGELGQGDPGFLLSFLDDNAYGREEDKSFWIRGESRADFVIKTNRPIRKATFTIAAGPVAADVKITISGRSQSLHLEPGQSTQVAMAMPPGLPFEKEIQGGMLWIASISCSSGFSPIFYDPGAKDARYLGVRVKPMLEARP